MTFRTALSGLNAAQSDLNVTANNIANSSTTGFKRSRAEFAELFAVSPQGVATLATGNGVRVSDVSQQFAQGSIDFTDSNLDLALSGPGFFTVSDGGALAYTRAGAFKKRIRPWSGDLALSCEHRSGRREWLRPALAAHLLVSERVAREKVGRQAVRSAG